MKRGFAVGALIVGIGLVGAPAVFGMFSRAPKGGQMMKAFRPYMTHANVAKFQGYMAEIDRADQEATTKLPALLAARADLGPPELTTRFRSVAQFTQQWPTIKANMSGDMLTKMDRMVPNYRAVNALPPFPLFPWFFVIPGLCVVVIAGLALHADRRYRLRGRVKRALTVLVVFGVAIAAAPAVFGMFTRAPKGAQMISTFRPLMTTKRVTTVQNYFIVLGAGEGQLRNQVNAVLVHAGMTPQEISNELPALAAFHRDWPHISSEMAPMIGVMSDNVGNYDAVKALPPFWLFPWFFVLPGLLIAGFGFAARKEDPPVPAGPSLKVREVARASDQPLDQPLDKVGDAVGDEVRLDKGGSNDPITAAPARRRASSAGTTKSPRRTSSAGTSGGRVSAGRAPRRSL